MLLTHISDTANAMGKCERASTDMLLKNLKFRSGAGPKVDSSTLIRAHARLMVHVAQLGMVSAVKKVIG